MNYYKVALEFNSDNDSALDNIEDAIMEELKVLNIEPYNIQVTITKLGDKQVEVPDEKNVY